jgi:hypothetical protein
MAGPEESGQDGPSEHAGRAGEEDLHRGAPFCWGRGDAGLKYADDYIM